MPNAFTKAASKAKAPTGGGGTKKDQNIIVLDAEQHPDVVAAIDEFVEADAREKQAKSDKGVAKGTATPHCVTQFLNDFARTGKKPSTIKFRTPIVETKVEGETVRTGGNTVTLVIQDRGELYKASPEQVETIAAIVGEDKVEAIVKEDTTFSFDNDILEKPGVMDKLGHAIAELVTSGTISETDGENILVATPRTTIRKGVVDDLAQLCGKDPILMEQLLAAVGSHSSQFIKA
jgi:hypothetical protein